jgi:hypothetical protein
LRHQRRFWTLVSEHTHAVNAAVTGLSALPGTAQPFAAARAMTRFLNHPDLSCAALIEPAQAAVRTAVAGSASPFALVVHDWSMFNFHRHRSKTDRYTRTHATDCGYELGTSLVVDAATGQPLGPMAFRLRTGEGMRSTTGPLVADPPNHLDELTATFADATRWDLGKVPVHIVDREADSVGHYRTWRAAGHHVLIRALDTRIVTWRETARSLAAVARELAGEFRDVTDAAGQPVTLAVATRSGRLRVAETEVVLDRPAVTSTRLKTARGRPKKITVPGEPLPMRLVVTQVVADDGAVLATWFLLTSVPAEDADAATIGRWYAWRWRIETFHKLLKTAGLNAEAWQQESGEAFLRRILVAAMACLTVWHLQRDPSDLARRLRTTLVRLSGRLMKHRVESTAPALLAGLEKLLALDDLLQTENLTELLTLARHLLPTLFRSG